MCAPALRSHQGVLELLELGLQGSFEALHVGAETKGSLKEQFVVLLLSQLSSLSHDSLKNTFIHWLNFRVWGRKSTTPDTPARKSVASWWQDGESASCYSEWDIVYRLFCLGVLFCEWLWVAGTSHRSWEGGPGVLALEETAMEMNSGLPSLPPLWWQLCWQCRSLVFGQNWVEEVGQSTGTSVHSDGTKQDCSNCHCVMRTSYPSLQQLKCSNYKM